MRKILAVVALIICTMGLIAVPVMTKPVPTTFIVPTYTYQLQWRAANGPLGWTFTNSWFSDPATCSADDSCYVYTLQGKELNTTISYSPAVTNPKGGDTEYRFEKESGFWTQEKTQISYNYQPLYGSYRVTNHFIGYLAFYDGMPSATTFVHGVMYQFIYISAKQSDTGVRTLIPNAVWDKQAHAWLVGFSIYLYDRGSVDYSWVPFPDSFPALIPEDVYNPLSL